MYSIILSVLTAIYSQLRCILDSILLYCICRPFGSENAGFESAGGEEFKVSESVFFLLQKYTACLRRV
jgi:hypothetical protein